MIERWLDGIRFAGLPWPIRVVLWIELVLVTGVLVWSALLFVASWRHDRARVRTTSTADDFLWVFLVPALNEEVTITDSVQRLTQVEARHRLILVVDDGSDDATGDVLARLAHEHDEVAVITRRPPDARQGKAEALNAAWARMDHLLTNDRWKSWTRDRVIVVVVDADGRLDPLAPGVLAARFGDDAVGGVQCRVRIYNRQHVLTWLQDVEFGVYGGLFQAGRGQWRIAGMGGNGQANRLSALDDLHGVDATGPWRNTLTEDQDLGLRLLRAGWACDHDNSTSVHQQGLSHPLPLYRQRTRWAQGNLQALAHLRQVRRMPIGWRRVEVAAYLMNPILQWIVGLTFMASVVLLVLDVAPIFGDHPWEQFAPIVVISFGGLWLGCVARNRGGGLMGFARATMTAPVYAVYSWMIWPVLARAALRQLSGRGSWAKTGREAIEPDPVEIPARSADATD